ncbi:MAG: HlyD family efflux transporter periplasmic adaptor subunit [Chloroflexota bacterium]
MWHRRKTYPYLLLLSAVAVLISACGSLTSQETPLPQPQVEEERFVQVVSSTGVVVPTQWVRLSMTTAGVVETLLVNEDDVVTANQLLVRLQGKENLEAAIAAARFEVVSAQRALDALYEDSELALALAQQAVVSAQQAIEDAQRWLNNLGNKASQADIDQAYANLILAKDKLEKAQEDYGPYKNKPEDNVMRAAMLSKLAQAQKDYDAALRKYNYLIGTADELDYAKAEADLALAKAQLVVAQRHYKTLQAGPDPDDVAVAEARLVNAQAQLKAAQAAFDDLELHAPFAGTVCEIYIHADEWITPGQPVLLLADLGHLRLETTDMNEIDSARIKIGDRAIVTFDAFPDLVINGTVVRIASKASEGAGVNYRVIIELDEIPQELRWGMTAFVDIQPGELPSK